MNVIETDLPGVLIVEPDVFGDERGFLMETWNRKRYEEAGLPTVWAQDNLSFSQKNVLRGLHFQNPGPQGKLVYVLSGEVFDVAVDIREGSPTFGEWTATTLSSKNRRQFWVPEGFAHGFAVLSDTALFAYKCTTLYNAEADAGVFWNDPDIGIEWPIAEPMLSGKDKNAPRLAELPAGKLPKY